MQREFLRHRSGQPTPAPARSSPQQAEASFADRVDLGTVRVTVADARRAPIADLQAGEFRLSVNGRDEEIVVFLNESDAPLEVAVLLDTRLSPELRAEGLARELVNKIQFMRKKGGFRVTDRIAVALEGSPAILEALRVHEPFIREETLADTMSTGRAEGDVVKEWNINGEPATIALTRRS